MSDILDNGADPLAQFSAASTPLKIPSDTKIAEAPPDPFASAKAETAQVDQQKAEGTLPDPFASSKELVAPVEDYVSQQRAANPTMQSLTPAQIARVNRDIANSPDPNASAWKIGTAMQFARLTGKPYESILPNIDALSQAWTGKPYEPKTTWRALNDTWESAWTQYDLGMKGYQWAQTGGTDKELEKKIDELQAKIDGLDEDAIARPPLIDALKGAVGSMPQMIMGAIKGAGVVAGVGLLAAATGAEIGSAGFATPLAAGAAIGGCALVGSAVDMYQVTQGQLYVQMRKAGHSHDISNGVSALGSFAEAATEGLIAKVPILGAITGGGGLENILTKAVNKRLAQSGIIAVAAHAFTKSTIENVGEGLENYVQYFEGMGAESLAQALEDVGYKGPTPMEAIKESSRQLASGITASFILGFLPTGSFWEIGKDYHQAAYVKAKAQAAMREGLDFGQFKAIMSTEYDIAERAGYAPVLEGFDGEARDKLTEALWNAGKKEQTASKAKEEAAGLTAPDIGDEEAQGAPVNRDTSGRLYTQNRVVTTDDNGEIRSVFKLGDPTAKGKSKRLAAIDYETDGETLTIREVTGKIDATTKREFILDLLEQNPGKKVEWRPKSEEDQAIYDGLVQDNPRGPDAGIQWYSEKGTIDKVRSREAVARQLRTFIGKTDLKAEHIPAMVATMDNMAKNLGMTTDELVTTMMSEKGFTTEAPNVDALRQNVRGATSFERVNNALKSIVYFSQKADATTFFHEVGHAYQTMVIDNRALNDKFAAEAAKIESAFGVVGGNWDAEATDLWAKPYLDRAKAGEGKTNLSYREAFSYAFEEYLRTGKAPTVEQQGIFHQIAKWFFDVYQAIAPKVKMNADITRVFDSMMSGDGPLSEVAKEGQNQEPQPAEATPTEQEYRPDMTDHEKDVYFSERNDEKRKKLVREMTPEEKDIALLTHEITHIPNRLAYNEDVQEHGGTYPIQVAIDADGLKWVNDNMGHEAGDAMLQKIGAELVISADKHGFFAYHEHGDEFIVQGEKLDDILRGLGEVENVLKSAILEEDEPVNGEKMVLKGLGFSAGIDDQGRLKNADQRLYDEKNFRESTGERAHHGTIPAGLSIVRESGEEHDAQAVAAAIDERARNRAETLRKESQSLGSSLSPLAVRALREQLKTLPASLHQGARDVENIVYAFPEDLKGYSDIHSQGQLGDILQVFGRGVIDQSGKDVRIGAVGTSHAGLASGMTDAKRFYFGYNREKQAVYVVAKNGMDTDFLKRPAVLQNILSQVFDKYKLSVSQGKKLAFLENDKQIGAGKPKDLFQGEAPQEKLKKIRGEWTKEKIIDQLKEILNKPKGTYNFSQKILQYENAQDLLNHTYYHGTGGSIDGTIKPSITFSDRKAEQMGGGGYGQKYWGISLSKEKRIAENFSGQSKFVSVYPVLLDKQANVVTLEGLTDAADVEDRIEELWNKGIDAVQIGGGEKELLVLNPYAVTVYSKSDTYPVFGGNKSGNLTIEKAQAAYDMAKKVIAEGRPEKGETLPRLLFQDEAEKLPLADKKIDGLTVRDKVPNMGSIAATFDEYKILPGVRAVPIDNFNLTGKSYSKDETGRIERLASEINANKEINPLIVVKDKEGYYILEGGHRAEALYSLGIKNIPAIVVKDETPGVLFQDEAPDTPEFKAWFGDSKVVDDEGKPLVVYHGSPDARGIVSEDGKFQTFKQRYDGNDPNALYFFTNSKGAASTYADDHRASDYQNAEPAIVPAYVSLNNPLEINANGQKWGGPKGQQEIVDRARKEGRDGIIIRHTIDDYTNSGIVPIDVYVAFRPEQIKSVNNRGTWDPNDPRILYQDTLEELQKDALTFKTWEEFRDFNEATSTDEADDMSPAEKDDFYRSIWENARERDAESRPTAEEIDDEEADAQFSDEIKTDAGLRAYLLDLFGAAYDKDFIRDVERVGPSDEEEAAQYDAMKTAESIVEKSAAPAVYLGAQGVVSGKATTKILAAARTIILNNPTEYRRLAAIAQGDQETASRLDAKISKPYILDPRWVGTAATLTIEKRRRLARTIHNEKLARKIARGDLTVKDADLEEHVAYLTEQSKALRKEIAEKDAKTQELDDRLETTQRAALKQERALREYQDRRAAVEKRARAYQDRQAKIPAKTEAERKLLDRQIADTEAALQKVKKEAKTDAAYLESMASTLATQKERNRLKAMEAERRALKGIKAEMQRLAASATKPLGKNARVVLEYKTKIAELQAQLDPNFRTAKTLEKLGKWRDFLMKDPGNAEIMPDELIKRVQAKPLNDWTLDEVKQFKERIDALRQAGSTTWKIRHNAEQAARNLMAGEFKTAALAGQEFRPSVGRAKPSSVWTKAKLATFRPLALFMQLDGDKRGAFTNWLFDKYNDAVSEKHSQVDRRKAEVMAKIKNLGFTLNPLDAKGVYIGKEVDIDGFTYSNGRKPTIQDVAYWSIGLQNEETKRALIAGNFLPEAVMEKAVQRMTAAERGLADAISADFDGNFDRLKEAFEFQYNMPLAQTGHYVPMRRLGVTYDTRGEEVAVGLVSGTGQVKTFLNKGFTKNRKEITDSFQTPIRTDLVSLWAESLEKEEAFISEDWLIKRLQDTLNRPEVSRSIQQSLGPAGVQWMKKYVNDIAQGDAGQAITGTQKLMQRVRGQMAVSYLSFNVLSNLKQLVSVLPYIADANPFHIVGAAGQYIAGTTGGKNKLTAFVEAHSDLIKNRSISREFEDVKRMEAGNQSSPAFRTLIEVEKRFGAWGMKSLEVIDHVSVCIGWKAVYDNKIAKGMSELEAIQAADDATVLTQPSGRVQDLAEIYRSGETMKMFTMFTNALNAQWNMMAYRIPAAIRQKKYLHALGDMVALSLCGLGIALVSGAAAGGDDKEKKKRLVLSLFSQYTDSLPLVGSYVTSALDRGFGVKTFTPSGVTPFPWGTNLVNAVGAITQGDIDKAFANMAEGAAYGLGLPVSEPKRIIKALIEKDPTLAIGWPKEPK